MADDVVKISANLPKPVISALQDMAREQNISMTEVLRRAISHERYFTNAVREDKKILIEDPSSGKIRELIFEIG
jgi:hypothetical protein